MGNTKLTGIIPNATFWDLVNHESFLKAEEDENGNFCVWNTVIEQEGKKFTVHGNEINADALRVLNHFIYHKK